MSGEDMEAAVDPQQQLLRPAYQRRFIVLMFLVCLFDFADRAVFAVVAQPIKLELALTDFQIGLLQGLAFALLYSILGLPLGRLAERASRQKIIAACTALWSSATAWCGFATGFVGLAIGRIGVGMGEAGFLPACNSMVADQFPKNRRASAMSVIMLGTPVGVLTGSLVGGFVSGVASWREAFFVLGGAGIFVALLVLVAVREPRRGLVDGLAAGPKAPPDFPAFLRTARRKPALLFVIAGGSVAGFGMTSISQFLAVFLARVHDMEVREAAAYYGSISATFLALGLLIGSFGTDWLAKRDARWPAWGAALGLCTAPFIYFLAFNAESRLTAAALLILAGTTLLIFYGPTSGMIQNLLEPRMRATGIACFALLYTLFGSGLGPPFVGFVSDRMASAAFGSGDFHRVCVIDAPPAGSALAETCAAASAEGVQSALLICVCIFFLAGLFYLLASRTLNRDYYDPAAASDGS